jgi:hypothetical protein
MALTFGDVNDELTNWLYRKAPGSGSFVDSGRRGFNGLEQRDVFDELEQRDVFDGLEQRDVFDVGPDDLCPLGDLRRGELVALSDFDGFWSSVTSGITKVAKVVKEKGVPVLKYGIPGVKDLGNELKKVGRFVVKSPLLQKALESAIPVVGPFITGPMLEVAASMVEQQGKKILMESGLAPTVANLVAKIDGQKPSTTESSPNRKVLPSPATVGFSPLPAAGIKKVDFAAALAAMHKLDPVRQKVAQRFVRAGIPALTAIDVVASIEVPGQTPSGPALKNMAYVGSLKLQHARAGNLAGGVWLPRAERAVAAGNLGDIIAFEGDCHVGELLVREMQTTFRQLSGVGKDELDDADVAFMRRFGPPVTSIVEEFNRQEARIARQIPFNLVCADIKELGVKAQALTREMRDARQVAQTKETPITSPFTPGPAGLSSSLGDLVKVLGFALAAAIVLPAVFRR